MLRKAQNGLYSLMTLAFAHGPRMNNWKSLLTCCVPVRSRARPRFCTDIRRCIKRSQLRHSPSAQVRGAASLSQDKGKNDMLGALLFVGGKSGLSVLTGHVEQAWSAVCGCLNPTHSTYRLELLCSEFSSILGAVSRPFQPMAGAWRPVLGERHCDKPLNIAAGLRGFGVTGIWFMHISCAHGGECLHAAPSHPSCRAAEADTAPARSACSLAGPPGPQHMERSRSRPPAAAG